MPAYKISPEEVGTRLDVFVAQKLPQISRSSVKKLEDQGSIMVNDAPSRVSYKLRAGDTINVNFDVTSLNQTPKIDLPILYEDKDCIVIDKPAGVLTHSKGAFNPEGTVATFIADKLTDLIGGRAGIVHRLDRATSGVIICAKNPVAQSWLQNQFAQRRVKKTYLAVVEGHLDPPEAMIDIPIGRHPRRPQSFRPDNAGKPAKTHYQVLKTLGSRDLVELKPETGRTHQLRVHMKHLGHAIVGDTLYDGPANPRMLLHAYKLELTLPSHERRVFTSKPPKELSFSNEAITQL